MNTNALTRIFAVALAFVMGLLAVPQTAEANLAFFRNYPDLDWKVIKTEHFNVFYPVSKDPDAEHYINGELTGRKTAYVAEEMYPLVCGQFNFYLDETINIVMLDQTDHLTGYTVPMYDWIVVSGRHSDGLWRMRGHHDWLRNVMYHEYAHVVSLKADQVFSQESFGAIVGARWSDGRINTNVGASAFIMKGDPWFWVEGGAEYYTDVAGINTWTSNRDMRMRMDILEGMALNFDDMGDYAGSHGGYDGNRHYLSGYSFALYLEQRFGEGVYQSFALNRRESGWTPNWLTVIEQTLNVTGDELYADWIEWEQARYGKVRDTVMEDPAIGAAMTLGRDYWKTGAPPAIEKVEFLKGLSGADRYKWRSDREGGYARMSRALYRVTPDGTGLAGSNSYGVSTSFSLDEQVDDLFPALSGGPQWGELGDSTNAAWDAVFSKGWQLPLASRDGQFDFSPDGQRVLTVCPEDRIVTKSGRKFPLFTEATMNLDGYNWTTLCWFDLAEIEAPAREAMLEHFGYDPMAQDRERWEMARRGIKPPKLKKSKKPKDKWRHWGNWVAETLPENADDLVHTFVDLEGKTIRRVSYPAWSPDGSTVVFVRYNDSTMNLWTADVETGVAKPITNFTDATRFEITDWSPDGEQIVAGVYRYDQQDIYVLDKDGSNARPLTFDKFEDRDPHWGQDGNIYFTSDRVGGIYNVFKLNPDIDPAFADRDLDGIGDNVDSCPDERETVNLYKDSDGCPDAIPVRVTEEQVVIDERVHFEFGEAVIKDESFELLSAVAKVMTDNLQITSIEVGGHTDDVGSKRFNLDLSARRAQAVADFLVTKGVDASRLSAKGFGRGTPLVREATDEARATNRRVEFTILSQTPVTKLVEMAPTEAAPADLGCGESDEEKRIAGAYLTQITNVVSGAFWPTLTPAGNLIYSHYDSFGYAPYGLRCQEFHNKVINDPSMVIAEGAAPWNTEQEVYPSYAAVTEPVKSKASYLRNPLIIPIIELANTSLTHLGLSVGVYMQASDILDNHVFSFQAIAGEDLLLWGRYTNKSYWPELYLGGMFRSIKSDYGFNYDADGSAETEDDQFLADIKQGYYVYGAFGGIGLPFASNFSIDLSTFQYGVGMQTVTDGKSIRPLRWRGMQTVAVNFTSRGLARSYSRGGGANPRGGRSVNFRWSPNFTIQQNRSSGGVDPDDGQLFDNYFYNKFELSYSEYIKLPFKNKRGSDLGHTLQASLEVGMIDRNVPYGDEIRGGGSGGQNFRNPYKSNTVFAGYEPYSLSGETAMVLNLQYRFPLARNIDKKIGPLYIASLYAQVFGTVGNFWSYKVKDDAQTTDLFGERVLADEDGRRGGVVGTPAGLMREWPGMVASENGHPVLADIGFELRLDSMLFNRSRWQTSIRVAYGLMGVKGRGDVDGDSIYTNSSDPTLDNTSDEVEPAGFRFLIGIGTGW